MEESRFTVAREKAREFVASGLFSGCVVADAESGPAIAEGLQCFRERKQPMTERSVFDIASVGKTMTAALAAQLVVEGRLDPDAPFVEYLPDHILAREGCAITVRDLATHSGGFDNSKPYQQARSQREFVDLLLSKRPVRPRGEAFCYACSNFIYIGMMVERLTGLDLDAAARQRLWGPLGMSHTTWNPVPDDGNVVEFDPSTYAGTGPRRIGEHNDYCCHFSAKPLGSGSVFSTIGDMRLFLSDMLHRRLFPAAYYDLLFAEGFSKGGVRRTFGWDMVAPKSESGFYPGEGFSDAAIAHTGWTGMTVVVDPRAGFAGAFLGSRVGGWDPAMHARADVLKAMLPVHGDL